MNTELVESKTSEELKSSTCHESIEQIGHENICVPGKSVSEPTM